MKISIITASYNCANFIEKTIKSILTQSYENWELIIVDDGSSDDSINIISRYLSDKIKLFQHENNANKGLKETIKLGISKAQSSYIAFLECDDYWDSNYLLEKIKILEEKPEINLIFNDVEFFGNKEIVQEHEQNRSEQGGSWYRDISSDLLICNIIPTFSAVLVKKETLSQCNFDTPIDAYLDWWLWNQIAINNKIYFHNKRLTFWQRHANSYMKTSIEIAKLKKIFNKEIIEFTIKNKASNIKSKLLLYFYKYIFDLENIKLAEKIFRKIIIKSKKTILDTLSKEFN